MSTAPAEPRTLSLLTLSAPLLESHLTSNQAHSASTNDDAHHDSNASANNQSLTPSSLSADLTHYRDLFSKLRFSYLEQVTKEKYLRSIVGDPPLLVSHAENLALEEELAQTKAELKARKQECEDLVKEMEGMARELARRYEGLEARRVEVERLPGEIEGLEVQVQLLQERLEGTEERGSRTGRSSDPRMSLGLEQTQNLIEQQRQRSKELDKQIAALQRQMPAKDRDCENATKELEALERRRNDATTAARDAQKLRAEGGRDEPEEKGRWYKSAESVLTAMVGS